MSNNSPRDILLAIEATLTASPSLVPATIRQLVIGRDPDHSAGFPFCCVYLADFTSPVADTVSYERTYVFAIEFWQEATAKAKRDAELDYAGFLHTLLNRLQGTWQLGIGVEGSSVENGPVRAAEIDGTPAFVSTIRFSVLTLVQNPA